jgi:hypothetical protein
MLETEHRGDVVETGWTMESDGVQRTSWSKAELEVPCVLRKVEAIWQTSWIRSMSADKGSNCKVGLA